MNDPYAIPAPVLNSSDGKKWKLGRFEFEPIQAVEGGLSVSLSLVLFLWGLGFLGWEGPGIVLRLGLSGTMLAAGYFFTFVPVGGRRGLAWLWLLLRWRLQAARHHAVSRQAQTPWAELVEIEVPDEGGEQLKAEVTLTVGERLG